MTGMKGAAGVIADVPEGYPDEDMSIEGGKKQVAFFGVYDGFVTPLLG
jgi:hypothetical protein